MKEQFGGSSLNQKTILDHPVGLFVLFFTEMWERFSYYGMRALLVLFLTASILEDGWEWSNEDAVMLYGYYTSLVYLTPIIGGFLADKFLGFRKAVVLGALLMTLGHLSLAFETTFFFYLGLSLLVLGNGFFKPNISSMVGKLYSEKSAKKDAAYTIFYMGINAGAFLGILLCGYIGERIGWSYGFGLAGVFMFFGMLQFHFSQKIFGNIGLSPNESKGVELTKDEKEAIAADDATPANVKADRVFVISIFALVTVFFWMAFEQAGGSMTIFAKDYTQRILSGNAATIFFWTNFLLTVVPLAIITYVLFTLISKIFKHYPLANLFLGFSFVIIWGIAGWMLNKDFNTKAYEVEYSYAKDMTMNDTINEAPKVAFGMIGSLIDTLQAVNIADTKFEKVEGKGYAYEINYSKMVTERSTMRIDEVLANDAVVDVKKPDGDIKYIAAVNLSKYPDAVKARIIRQKTNELEVPASWFSILNSFFIIALAPLFSKLWESFPGISGPQKFAMGLISLGFGFAILAIGSMSIADGMTTASISLMFLVFAYLFHTMGELCVSPVGLSYVSKLAPIKLIGLMFGIWFIANFAANFLAGLSGSYIDHIAETYSISTFFWIFTLIPIVAGIIMLVINPILKKKMHGIN